VLAEIDAAGDSPNDFLYTGQQLDPDTGLYYLRARYYDPADGRFTSRDPFAGSPHDPPSLHKYLYCRASPVDKWDPTGWAEFSLGGLLANISIRAQLFVNSVPIKIAAAFASGGTAVGRLWNMLGAFAENTFRQILALRPDIVVNLGPKVSNRVIDFCLQSGNKVAIVEVKYGLPWRRGDSLARLVDQLTKVSANRQDQLVLWTLKEPTIQQINLLRQQLNPQVLSRVKLVHGVDDLWRWLTKFFGPG
jgi:RHS repeat-associated protein